MQESETGTKLLASFTIDLKDYPRTDGQDSRYVYIIYDVFVYSRHEVFFGSIPCFENGSFSATLQLYVYYYFTVSDIYLILGCYSSI